MGNFNPDMISRAFEEKKKDVHTEVKKYTGKYQPRYLKSLRQRWFRQLLCWSQST